MRVDIRLHGKLGKEIGEHWQLYVNSVGEAMRGIEANSKKLFQYFYECEKDGVEYRVLINGRDHTDDSDLVVSRKTLREIDIVPVPAGAGGGNGGMFKMIIGLFLVIVASVVTFGVAAPGAIVGFASFFATMGTVFAMKAVFMFGAALLLGGLFELVSGSPKSSNGGNNDMGSGESEKAELAPSYLFGGAVNTANQGNPIPIGYGRLRIGSQVIAAGVRSTAIPV